MKNYIGLFAGVIMLICSLQVFSQDTDSLIIRKIYDEALTNPIAYRQLEFLCKNFQGRLCGSDEADKAVAWVKSVLEGMDLDTVFLQPVMVPHWERGKTERARVCSEKSGTHDLNICAIGGSVPTPREGISAKVVEVKSFEQLRILGREAVSGKIVFFNRPADKKAISTFQAYGGAVDQRARGVIHAGRLGALAVIVRSATTAHDDFPHTGILHYADSVKSIPAISVSTNGADSLSQWLLKDVNLELEVNLDCSLLPQKQSYNIIGEVRGALNPRKIIAFGGHLDAWDIGEGAHDDGAGVVQTIEILRIFQSLRLKPVNTLRVVVFMDEEYAQSGGHAYGSFALERNEQGIETHLFALEADRGGTTPVGFSIDGTDQQVDRIKKRRSLLIPYGLWFFEKGGSGVDIRDLKPLGIPLIALATDSHRYFDYHHSANDTFDKINIREFQLGAAAMTALIWLEDRE